MSEQSCRSLEEVQEAFARWRAGGRSWRTPTNLRSQAVALLERYRVREITQALGVDHKRLRQWRRELSNTDVISQAISRLISQTISGVAIAVLPDYSLR